VVGHNRVFSFVSFAEAFEFVVRGCNSSYPIPDHMNIGAVIGQHGRNVKYIEEQSGATCRVDKELRRLLVTGTPGEEFCTASRVRMHRH
jgi:hypothetical protein